MSKLSFQKFMEINGSRIELWHSKATEPWTMSDWNEAAAGELGEACNVHKKIRRIETGMAPPKDQGLDLHELWAKYIEELMDTVHYIFAAAYHVPIKTDDPVKILVEKFNRVSEENGFWHRLAIDYNDPYYVLYIDGDDGGPPKYLTITDGVPKWDTHQDDAIQFRDRISADMMRSMFLDYAPMVEKVGEDG